MAKRKVRRSYAAKFFGSTRMEDKELERLFPEQEEKNRAFLGGDKHSEDATKWHVTSDPANEEFHSTFAWYDGDNKKEIGVDCYRDNHFPEYIKNHLLEIKTLANEFNKYIYSFETLSAQHLNQQGVINEIK